MTTAAVHARGQDKFHGKLGPTRRPPGERQLLFARHCLARHSCDGVIPLARASALACAKPTSIT